MKRPSCFLIVGLIVTLIAGPLACAQRRQTSRSQTGTSGQSSNVDSEALEQAHAFLARFFPRCGSSNYYTEAASGQYGELEGFSIDIEPFQMTEADRLNGIEFRGHVRIQARLYRTSNPQTNKWNDWSQGSPMNIASDVIDLQKRRGKWTIDAGYFIHRPTVCDDVVFLVPGLKRSGAPEKPSNSIEIDQYHIYPIEAFTFWESRAKEVGVKFPQSSTFINWRIKYQQMAFSYDLPNVESYWLKDGKAWSYDKAAARGRNGDELFGRKGWDEPGHWEVGSYTVKVYLRKRLVAVGKFDIVPDVTQPAGLRYNGMYYKTFGDTHHIFRFFSDGTVMDLWTRPTSSLNLQGVLSEAWLRFDSSKNETSEELKIDCAVHAHFLACEDIDLGQGTFRVDGSQIAFTLYSKLNRGYRSMTYNGKVNFTELSLKGLGKPTGTETENFAFSTR